MVNPHTSPLRLSCANWGFSFIINLSVFLTKIKRATDFYLMCDGEMWLWVCHMRGKTAGVPKYDIITSHGVNVTMWGPVSLLSPRRDPAVRMLGRLVCLLVVSSSPPTTARNVSMVGSLDRDLEIPNTGNFIRIKADIQHGDKWNNSPDFRGPPWWSLCSGWRTFRQFWQFRHWQEGGRHLRPVQAGAQQGGRVQLLPRSAHSFLPQRRLLLLQLLLLPQGQGRGHLQPGVLSARLR